MLKLKIKSHSAIVGFKGESLIVSLFDKITE